MSTPPSRPVRRSTALGAAGALVLTALPFTTASAASTSNDIAEACDGAPDSSFTDEATFTSFEERLADCLSQGYGRMLRGDAAGNAEFEELAFRQQIAAIINRGADALGYDDVAPPSNPTFADVPRSNVHYADVEEVAARGLFNGTGDTDPESGKPLFAPKVDLSYAQSALLAKRLHDNAPGSTDYPAAAYGGADGARPSWAPDDCGVHQDVVDQLVKAGVVTEANAQECDVPVTRGHFFAMIANTVNDLVEDGVVKDAYAPDSNQTFTIAGDASTRARVVGHADDDSSDDARFTVDTSFTGTAHDFRLVTADQYRVDANGNVTFTDDDGDGHADLDAPATTSIVVVNGSSVTPTESGEVTPVNGQLSFTIDGDATNETVALVVFVDADNDGRLDVAADPDRFGVSAQTRYIPQEAPSGLVTSTARITDVDKDGRWFATSGARYDFDASDRFYLDADGQDDGTRTPAEQVTLEAFLSQLSVGDRLEKAATEYQRESSLQSNFSLLDVDPAAPAVSVSDVTARSMMLSITGVEDADSVTVHWAVEDGGVSATTTTPEYESSPQRFTRAATLTWADDADKAKAGIQWQLTYGGDTGTARDFSVAVTQTDEGEQSESGEVDNVTVPAVTESVAPTITTTTVTDSGSNPGLLDNGDVLHLVFSEDMVDSLGTDQGTYLRITDQDTTVQFACTVNGACLLDDNESTLFTTNQNGVSDDHLRIALSNSGTHVAGTDNGIDFAGGNARISLVSPAFDDQAGNQLDLAASSDVTVDA